MKETSSSDKKPTHEQITAAAYQFYVESGRQDGHEAEHWHRAEQLLNEQFAAARSSAGKPDQPQKSRRVSRNTSRRPAWLMAQVSRIF